MITNFESITSSLTDQEKNLIPILIAFFKLHSPANPITEKAIIRFFNNQGIILAGPRLRKLCNFIRANSLLPLMASKNGYFVSYDKVEIIKQIDSLIERSDAILRGAEGLKGFAS